MGPVHSSALQHGSQEMTSRTQNTQRVTEQRVSEDSSVTAVRRTRVLIVAPSFDILGGQSVQAASLLTRLDEEPSLEIGFLPINPRLPGIMRKLQAIKYVRTVVTSLLYVIALLVRVYKYDVIHIFSASYFSFVLAPTPAILVSKIYGKRILLNYHSGEAEDHLARWRRSAIPTIRLANALIVPSEYLVKVFSKFGLHAKAIYNIIDSSRFPFRSRSPLRPLFLSNRNLESHYGVDLVLQAFEIIQKEFPDASLKIVGDGSQRSSLERLAKELNLRNITFVGKVDQENIPNQYDEADIYLNGSWIDNQPLSLLEAFACGLPIVTTDAGGIPDIVSDQRTGLIVPCGDYRQMAKGAIRLLNDPELAKKIGEHGYAECRKYSWQAVRDAWLGVYRKLANVQPHSTSSIAPVPTANSERNILTL